MSADYSAYTIVGQKLRKADLFEHVEESVHKACGPTYGKYCHVCGKPADEIRYRIEPIESFDGYEGELNGVVVRRFVPIWSETDIFFAITKITRVSTRLPILTESMGRPNLEKCKEQIKTALEPLGMWNEEKFGIWTVLTGDY